MATKHKAKVRLVACEWRVKREGVFVGKVAQLDPGVERRFQFVAIPPDGQSLVDLYHRTRAAAVAALIAAKESDK